MAKVYRDLIKKSIKTIETIPKKYRKEVKSLLESEE